MSVIVDSSFLISMINQLEKHHDECVQVVNNLQVKFIIPVTVLPEVTYLLARRLGHHVMRDFVRQLIHSNWHIENLSGNDLERVHELLSVYKDSTLVFADATIIAMAERLDVNTILTLDRRDFRMVRPLHVDYFNLRP